MILIFAIVIYFSLLLYFQGPYKLEEKTETIYLVDGENDVEDLNASEHLIKSQITCDSQSMGLLLDCEDTVFSRILDDEEKLKEGKIYKYRNTKGYYIIHRLVKCLDENCETLVFKGDNNFIADNIIQRSEVEHEVVQIRYG